VGLAQTLLHRHRKRRARAGQAAPAAAHAAGDPR
jgi:hypothetical protein